MKDGQTACLRYGPDERRKMNKIITSVTKGDANEEV